VRARSHLVHLSFAVAVALLAGCEKQPQTCIGTTAVQFLLQGTLDETRTNCDFASKDVPAQTISVAATLAFDPGGSTASLCLDRPEAAPLTGTLADGSVDFQLSPQRNGLAACGSSCTVQIDERVHLDLTQDSTDKVTAIWGTVTDTVDAPLPSNGCHPTTVTDSQCALPCDVAYSITRVELQ
jgi:hypothetical protein